MVMKALMSSFDNLRSSALKRPETCAQPKVARQTAGAAAATTAAEAAAPGRV